MTLTGSKFGQEFYLEKLKMLFFVQGIHVQATKFVAKRYETDCYELRSCRRRQRKCFS